MEVSPKPQPHVMLLSTQMRSGYVLALIVEACIQRQSTSTHPDPIHVTAHYLRTTAIARFEVQIHTLRSGRGFTNITADLVQDVSIAYQL